VFLASAIIQGYILQSGEEPLRRAGLSMKERLKLRESILNRALPDDPAMRKLARSWAKYAVATYSKAVRWEPSYAVGLLLIFCGLYSVPYLSIVAVVIQCVLAVLRTRLFFDDLRKIRNSRDLVEHGNFGPS